MRHHLKVAEYLVYLLENRFRLFGKRFGLDPVLGVIPGIGDFIPFLLSFYIVWIATRLNVPEEKIEEMIRNIIFDFLIGLVPIVGDVGDIVFKSNTKNLAIVKRFARSHVVEGIIS